MIIENKNWMDIYNKKINKKYIGLGCYVISYENRKNV